MTDTLNKILLIDDDPNIQELVRVNLEIDGLEVEGALTGQEGLARSRETAPDLILLDMMLPDTNGLDILDKLLQDEKTMAVPVFMLSARSMLPDMEKALSKGARGYLGKPFDPTSLAEHLQEKFTAIRQKPNNG